ncbi:hypothetical protein BJY21_000832 [Kineosphaera limosa]|uniref:Uncharacterized protein n=1 Tax=Kineosphaera limosa NBRC 100340 TaxID=1184609 RepID=K6WU12_9MICO|nr:hypothetical protein [Kineosphaera limosa]NYD99647.1 hypothetical protein [Kineosphaera limosa]GAB95602.1 hypothetical protein KILIM_024_00120 [Kineosphaera limosa NBRC 100340]
MYDVTYRSTPGSAHDGALESDADLASGAGDYPPWDVPPADALVWQARAELAEQAWIGAGDESAAVAVLLQLADRHGSGDLFTWGPQLVRAVLDPAEHEHRSRPREGRELLAGVLRRVIVYGHQRRNVDPEWHALTLAAFDRARTGFLRDAPTASQLVRDARVAQIAALVGGRTQLAALTADPRATEPLPDEALDLDRCPPDVHERLRHIDALLASALAGLTTGDAGELRTITRRILARAGRRAPELFRRRSRDERIAAGIAIVAVEGNDHGPCRGWARADIAARLDEDTSAHLRGLDVLRAAGIARVAVPLDLPTGSECAWLGYGDVLADPALQTSLTRRLVLATHEALLAETADAVLLPPRRSA